MSKLQICKLFLSNNPHLDVGDNNPEIYVEYLSDGSYFIVEVNQAPTMGRSSGTSGNKRATYYIDNDIPIYSVDVHGTFTYDGISLRQLAVFTACQSYRFVNCS